MRSDNVKLRITKHFVGDATDVVLEILTDDTSTQCSPLKSRKTSKQYAIITIDDITMPEYILGGRAV